MPAFRGICEKLKAEGRKGMFVNEPGCCWTPIFREGSSSGSWTRCPALRARGGVRGSRLGTIDSWLIARLTRGACHGLHQCSRTLMSHPRSTWDPDLLHFLDIPLALLPQVVAFRGMQPAGRSRLSSAPRFLSPASPRRSAGRLSARPVRGRAGQEPLTVPECFLLLNVGRTRSIPGPGLLLTLACDSGGCLAMPWKARCHRRRRVQWLRDGLGLIRSAGRPGTGGKRCGALGVYVVPAFAGWAPPLGHVCRGGILGITRGTNGPTSCARPWRASLPDEGSRGAVEAATG